jgi:hypothetical protein
VTSRETNDLVPKTRSHISLANSELQSQCELNSHYLADKCFIRHSSLLSSSSFASWHVTLRSQCVKLYPDLRWNHGHGHISCGSCSSACLFGKYQWLQDYIRNWSNFPFVPQSGTWRPVNIGFASFSLSLVTMHAFGLVLT